MDEKVKLLYTKGYGLEADKVVAGDMRHIIKAIHCNIGVVEAVILEGSYGRGEGAMIWASGRWMPVNDYDICIVVNRSLSPSDLISVRKDLLKQSDISRLDITSITSTNLRKLSPRLINFDRKYGGQVIHGDTTILGQIPEMQPDQIPLFEVEKEYYTRMIAFIVSFEEKYLKSKMSNVDIFRMRQQVSKALIACANAVLISRGQYHSSFEERCRRFSKIGGYDKQTNALILDAFEFKARPVSDPIVNPISYYFVCRDAYVECFRQFVEKMYKRKIRDWCIYSESYINSYRNLMIRLSQFVTRRSSHIETLRLNLVQLFLVCAVTKDGLNKDKIEYQLLINELQKFRGVKVSSHDWDSVRKVILQKRM